MKLLTSIIVLSAKLSIVVADCTDIYGKTILPNTHYVPGPDICQLCVCDNTSPKWCKRVLCSPPANCKSFVMGNSCCDYSCLDHTLPNGELKDEIDRRFLITIATAFFILTILLFVIHKLRHRPISGHHQNRPLNEDRRSLGSIGFITGSIGYLNLPNGHNFDDHSIVHFPIYKPNGFYPRGEAPPPYDEAIADTRLTTYTHVDMISNERNLYDPNQQRRQYPPHIQPRILDANGNCIYDPRPGENGIFVNDCGVTDNYGGLSQHRTIPLPLCVNADQVNNTAELPQIGANNQLCPLHKKNNEHDHHRARANSTNQRRSCSTTSRPHTCPPQFHSGFVSISEAAHRALPLSASLSSPLPSTSDADRQSHFPSIILGPNSSSAINICSSSKEDRSSAAKKHHHKTCRKALQAACAEVAGETPLPIVKCSKERKISKSSTCMQLAPNSTKECKEESQEASQRVEDYYAECENCNLNVAGDGADVSDEYFSKQETMTLQRKLHEVSASQTLDKVSLTLPTNSRTRRSSKNKKCGMWNAKESPFKGTLEYVSSEDEAQEEGHNDEPSQAGSQELSATVLTNADNNEE